MTTELIKPGCLVFDIGAHVGGIAKLFLEAGAGKVICVEPCFRIFNELVKVPGIIPIHAAVWSHTKLIGINFCQNEAGHSTCDTEHWKSVFPDDVYDPPEWVTTTTVNDLSNFFGIPSVIKIDTEGSEKTIITSLNYRPDFLIFEYHVKLRSESMSCLLALRDLGFTKATNLDGELDICRVPSVPIDQFIEEWKTKDHGLGNITVG